MKGKFIELEENTSSGLKMYWIIFYCPYCKEKYRNIVAEKLIKKLEHKILTCNHCKKKYLIMYNLIKKNIFLSKINKIKIL